MFEIIKEDSNSQARLGNLKTGHGVVDTPAYIIVGTNAQVRTLSSDELNKTDIQIIIANTYHLWQELGEKKLEKFRGLHNYMGWQRPLMTDSGGFQVFSMGYGREFGGSKVKKRGKAKNNGEKNMVRVEKDGVYFKTDKGEQYIDPKRSVWIQEKLGADIILAFDEPSSPYHDHGYTKEAMERTHRWAKESLDAKATNQKMFGIVQGGIYQDLREMSAKYISSLPFDGYSLGGAFGDSFGSKSKQTFAELDWMIPHLNKEKPRHLLGIGRVRDIFIGVKKGIDLFDCVIPTREARHGKLYTKTGEINIKNAKHIEDSGLIDDKCQCQVCSNKIVTRSGLRKLFKNKDKKAGQYSTIHNIHFFNQLMREIRNAINKNQFKKLRDNYFKYY